MSLGKMRRHYHTKYKAQSRILDEFKRINYLPGLHPFRIARMQNAINDSLDKENRIKITPKREGGRRILYVTDYLDIIGGTETRLEKQLRWLTKAGFECLIMVNRSQRCKLLECYPNLHLIFYAENFSSTLVTFVKYANIDFVEFQAKKIDYLSNVNFEELNNVCTTGLCIHSVIELDAIDFRWFTYVFRATSSWGEKQLEHVKHIPNWVEYAENQWNYSAQEKALFISRLDREKLPTLKSFIAACKKLGCNFEVAGPIQQSENTELNALLANIGSTRYLGMIDTRVFLNAHVNDYLFIGGVGQVSIEAAGYGIPSLICTHHANADFSRFVTQANFNDFVLRNFVISRWYPSDLNGDLEHFRRSLASATFDEFNVVDALRQKLSSEKILGDYIDMLNEAQTFKN